MSHSPTGRGFWMPENVCRFDNPPLGRDLRDIFPCYVAQHGIIYLDRYLYRLYDRRTNSRDLGWRHALLFGSVAQWRWRRCGSVARVAKPLAPLSICRFDNSRWDAFRRLTPRF
jgi:hypothetical protein